MFLLFSRTENRVQSLRDYNAALLLPTGHSFYSLTFLLQDHDVGTDLYPAGTEVPIARRHTIEERQIAMTYQLILVTSISASEITPFSGYAGYHYYRLSLYNHFTVYRYMNEFKA
jgi:hypothetical protein